MSSQSSLVLWSCGCGGCLLDAKLSVEAHSVCEPQDVGLCSLSQESLSLGLEQTGLTAM